MQGSQQEQEEVNEALCREVFETVERRAAETDDGTTVRISFYEVHQEQVFDLLNKDRMKVPLPIHERGKRFRKLCLLVPRYTT